MQFPRTLRALLLAAAVIPCAADAATIQGTVRNRQTGAFLEGAEVTIEGSSTVLRTDRQGRFATDQLPAGPVKVHIEYPGLTSVTLDAHAADGAVEPLEVAMVDPDSDVVVLDTFVVATEREGYAASVARQKAAANIQNVLSMDTYGTVADGNIGNFLQRVAGIAVNKDAGDAVGVIVRGAPPELNSVTLDGVRVASADTGINQGDRSVRIDHLPSEFIKEIEVVKANMPNQWADSIGGTVNLVTKSAFDYKSSLLTYQAGASVNTYRDDLWEWRPNGSVTYLTTLGANRQVGLSLSASQHESTHPRDWVQVQRLENDSRVTQARLLDDIVRRIRRGVSSKLEFRLPDNLTLQFDAAVNQYRQSSDRNNFNISDSAGRRVADYNRVSRAQIEAGTQPRTSTNQTASVAPGYTDTYTEMLFATYANQRARGEGDTETYKVGFNAKKEFRNGFKVDAGTTFSQSRSESSFNSFTITLRRIGLGIDTTNPERPVFTQTYGPSIAPGNDLDGYTGALALSLSSVEDEIGTAYINLSRAFDAAGVPVNLRAGAAMRQQERYAQNWAPRWNYVGADGRAGLNTATGINDDNLAQFRNAAPSYGLFNGTYAPRDQLSYQAAYAAFQTNPSHFSPATANVVPPPTIVEENVMAAYAMADAAFGKLLVTGGARYERTDVEASGAFNDPQNPDQISVTKTGEYDNFFPGVHLKYNATRRLVLRGSFTTSFARPSIANVAPTTTISYASTIGANGTVTQNNPNLKPQYSQNFDLAAEYYFRPSGVISVGVFRKDIDDFIASDNWIIGDGPDNGFGGLYEGFEYRTKINLGSARIEGLELDYNQQVTWIPASFGSLRVFANATWLRTTGSYDDGASELVNFVPRMINLGFSHTWRKLTLRAAYTEKSDYLASYSSSSVFNTYRNSPDETFDLNLRFNYRPQLAFYIDAVNVFNAGSYWYNLGDTRRVLKSEITGMRLTMGITGRF